LKLSDRPSSLAEHFSSETQWFELERRATLLKAAAFR
jgi:hypothetical protein